MGTRLLAFGVIGWLFLPLLPLVPLKLYGAHRANLRLNDLLRKLGFPSVIIRPGKKVTGFLFTPLDEGVKRIDVRLLGRAQTLDFPFTVEVPGLMLPHLADQAGSGWSCEGTRRRGAAGLAGASAALHRQRARHHRGRSAQSRDRRRPCEYPGMSRHVGRDRVDHLSHDLENGQGFSAQSHYRYSPVSPLYLDGHQQDLALQRARVSLNQRLHLRLWTTDVRFEGQPVWIGQVSRDIGVRFTPKTWNLTTHQIDPDVDEARDYVLDNLLGTGRVARLGFVMGRPLSLA